MVSDLDFGRLQSQLVGVVVLRARRKRVRLLEQVLLLGEDLIWSERLFVFDLGNRHIWNTEDESEVQLLLENGIMEVHLCVSTLGYELNHLLNIAFDLLVHSGVGLVEFLNAGEVFEDPVVRGTLFQKQTFEGSQFFLVFVFLLENGLDLPVAEVQLLFILKKELVDFPLDLSELVFDQFLERFSELRQTFKDFLFPLGNLLFFGPFADVLLNALQSLQHVFMFLLALSLEVSESNVLVFRVDSKEDAVRTNTHHVS